MARARLIDSAIWTDDWFGPLSFFDQAMWIGLFSQCADDQGRMLDNPILIRASVFPYKDVAVKDIETTLANFEQAGRIHRYEADGKRLIQLVNWWSHQRCQWAQPSQWPAPANWQDAIRTRQNNEYVQSGWDDSRGFQVNSSGERMANGSGEHHAEAPSRTVRADGHILDPDPDPDPDPVHDPESGDADAPPALDDLPFSDFEPEPEPEPEPASKKRRSRADPRTKHPAVQAVRHITGKLPPKVNYAALIKALGDDPDEDKMRRCLEAWTARGYNPRALTPFLEWYHAGVPSNGRASPADVGASVDAALRSFANGDP